MNPRSQLNPSQGFRHVSRPLREGEKIPRFPTLLEQVQACRAEMARAAREESRPRPAEVPPGTDEEAWEADLEDAA